jgi:hypothetical protein
LPGTGWLRACEGLAIPPALGLIDRVWSSGERYEAPPAETEMEAMAARAAMSPLFT